MSYPKCKSWIVVMDAKRGEVLRLGPYWTAEVHQLTRNGLYGRAWCNGGILNDYCNVLFNVHTGRIVTLPGSEFQFREVGGQPRVNEGGEIEVSRNGKVIKKIQFTP